MSRDEREALDHFTSLSAGGRDPVAVTIERAVIGADWGANGYLTRSQADELATLLRLGPGSTLLDVGAGRGWPGLYLARTSGCSVVLTDLPVEGLRLALDRAVQEGMAERVLAVAASAVQLPLRPASVDAVVQSDVLCWLTAKLSVLRAVRRVLRPGGRLAFATIELAPDVSRAVRRRMGDRVAPPAVATRRPYGELLASAGFTGIGSRDVTDAYRQTAQDWLAETHRHVDALRAASDPAELEELLATRKMRVEEIEAGHLRRWLYWADRWV